MEETILQTTVHPYTPATAFTLICGGRVVSIGFDQLVCIEKKGSYAILYTRESIYKTQRGMEEILKALPVNDFVRTSNAHIIALAHVSQFGRDYVSIHDTILPLTNYYKKQLIQVLAWKLNQSYQQLRYATGIRTPV